MSKNVDIVRKEGLDKFYTLPKIAKACIEQVGQYFSWDQWDLVVEPSAGNGSFVNQIPYCNIVGLDIEPDDEKITKYDFFDYTPQINGKVLVIGNPPFGKCSSLAIRFFNHAAEWCDVIAFIVPRTFRRVSVHNRLALNFHLIHDVDIPTNPCSFTPKMMVKCCFQIWQRQENARNKVILDTQHPHWKFLEHGPKDKQGQPTPPKDAHFALKAYGGKCGEIVCSDLDKLRPKSWHWIQAKIPVQVLIKNFETLDYSIAFDTARQNSIGRGELVELYKSRF